MGSLLNTTDTNIILERLDKLKTSSKPLWGKMTVNEMICHVSDPLRDVLKIRESKPAVPFILRSLLKIILLNNKPFSKNSPTVKPYLQDDKGKGTKPKGFDSDMDDLIQLIHQFQTIDKDFVLGNHAALGQLNQDTAARFIWKHLDHHLNQFGY